MPNISIDAFKAKLTGGGARANLFRVICNFPAFAQGNSELASFMIKATSMPGSVVSSVEVPFRGRHLKVAGDRTFEPWNITVINDTNMAIRNALERWVNGISAAASNTGRTNPRDYQVDMQVSQLDKAGNVVKTYTIRGAFPTNVSPIELSNEAGDAIEEFTCEFAYQYWESNTTTGSGFGGGAGVGIGVNVGLNVGGLF